MTTDMIIGGLFTMVLKIVAVLAFQGIEKHQKNNPKSVVSPELFKSIFKKKLEAEKKKGSLSINSLKKYAKILLQKDKKNLESFIKTKIEEDTTEEVKIWIFMNISVQFLMK